LPDTVVDQHVLQDNGPLMDEGPGAGKGDAGKGKDGGGGGGGGGHTQDRGAQTTDGGGAPAGDPNVISVTGGTVHRTTGTIDRGGGDTRTAVYCWIDVSANAACTDFKWYQWVCMVVTSVDLGDGKGPHKPKAGDASGRVYTIPGALGADPSKSPDAVDTATAAEFNFGHWVADDYSKANPIDKRPKDKSRQKMPTEAAVDGCEEPKTKPTAGLYFGPTDIPGLPNVDPKDQPKRETRLVDAPDLSQAPQAVNWLYYHLTHRGRVVPKLAQGQPPNGTPITVEVTYYFRDAVYCADNCLGRFDWSVSETIEITPTWVRESEAGPSPDLTGAGSYHVEGRGKRTKYGEPKFGVWTSPC
jgi:hypothetical protein